MPIQSVPSYTPVPTPVIQRGDRETFSNRVDTFISWLQVAPPQWKTLADVTYNNATIAEASAVTAVDAAETAVASAATAVSTVPVTSLTPPANPVENSVWIHADTLRKYTYTAVTGGFTWIETETSAVYQSLSTSEDQSFIAAGTGAVQRTTRDKLRDEVSVFDFMSAAEIADVMAGTLSLNVVSRFQAAIAVGRPVRVPSGPGWKYRFGSALLVPSGAVLHSDGAQIVLANGANSHVIRIADNAENVTIKGLSIDGRKANNTGGHGIASNGGSSIRVMNCAIKDCGAAGIYFAGAEMSGIAAHSNFITGCVAGGITANNTVTNFSFNDNHAWLNGTHGIGILGIAKHGAITGNVCWDNGQGNPTADNITGYNGANENITVSGNTCKGGLNNGIHMGGQRLAIVGNVVYDPSQYGIVMRPDTGVGDDCVMSNNVVYSAGVSGFWIEACQSGAVNGNVSRDNVGHGFAIDACANVTFTGNTARGNSGDGFRNGTASAWLTFNGNTSRNNGGDGIELSNVTDSSITGNVFRSNTGYGINVSGVEARNIIVGNTVRSNTAGQIVQPATTTRVSQNETGVSRTIAAAASLVLPPGGEYYYMTGTTNVTSIAASFPERRVTIQFDDALTVVDGGNLRLAGNFVTTYMDTLTLICDGTNWVETSRSAN